MPYFYLIPNLNALHLNFSSTSSLFSLSFLTFVNAPHHALTHEFSLSHPSRPARIFLSLVSSLMRHRISPLSLSPLSHTSAFLSPLHTPFHAFMGWKDIYKRRNQDLPQKNILHQKNSAPASEGKKIKIPISDFCILI